MAPSARQASIVRKTKETEVRLQLKLDGSGRSQLDIQIPFFEHMLTLLAGHGLLDLKLHARGDLEVDQHHLVEDVGITLGQALGKAVGNKHGLTRYGLSVVPMDEARVQVALDFSGRSFLDFGLKLRQKQLGGFDTELVVEFFRALATAAGLTLHITPQAGANTHHLVEATFKACGRALRQAVTRDRRQKGIPSTKGIL